MLGWLILWDRFSLSLSMFISVCQCSSRMWFSAGDNDDIPKITAIDYDGLSECRESGSSIFPGHDGEKIYSFHLWLRSNFSTRGGGPNATQSECASISLFVPSTDQKPYERSGEKIDCNFWRWILTSILFLFKFIPSCCFFQFRLSFLRLPSALGQWNQFSFRQVSAKDINHVCLFNPSAHVQS